MRKTALVTGASGGIGLELARVLAREGHDLWLVSRDASKLESIKKEIEAAHGVRVRTLPKDLSEPSSARQIFDETQKENVSIGTLVNNAGSGDFGDFADVSLGHHERVINLNVLSLTQLCRLFLGPMVQRRQGRVLNVASTAAFQPGPLLAVYYASKAFVLHLSEAISYELKGTGVTVTALCPGPTSTDFQKNAKMQGSKLFKGAVMSASAVAEIGFRGMIQGKAVVIPGFKNNLLARSYRFFPRRWVTAVVKKVQEDRPGR